VTPFCRRSVACGSKDCRNRTRELVTAQIVGWVNVTRRKNQPLQIWTLKKRGGKAALIWPCRRAMVFALHSYRLQPRSRGAFFFRCCRSSVARRWARPRWTASFSASCSSVRCAGCWMQTNTRRHTACRGRGPLSSDTTTTCRTMTSRVHGRFVCKLRAAV
jgi:hypothetical protein